MARTRSYEGTDITVLYDLKRCIHARECVRGLPEVFDPDRRPWVDPEESEADAVAAVIRRCPTGALQYLRHDGGPPETPPEPRIRLVPDGPLYVEGNIQLRDADGTLRWTETRAALCRCGASKNKPFCDNTHLDIDFKTEAST